MICTHFSNTADWFCSWSWCSWNGVKAPLYSDFTNWPLNSKEPGYTIIIERRNTPRNEWKIYKENNPKMLDIDKYWYTYQQKKYATTSKNSPKAFFWNQVGRKGKEKPQLISKTKPEILATTMTSVSEGQHYLVLCHWQFCAFQTSLAACSSD